MTLLEYEAGQQLQLAALNIRQQTGANPFYSLIHAAMREADTDNFEALKREFPRTFADLKHRRDAPGGILPGE